MKITRTSTKITIEIDDSESFANYEDREVKMNNKYHQIWVQVVKNKR